MYRWADLEESVTEPLWDYLPSVPINRVFQLLSERTRILSAIGGGGGSLNQMGQNEIPLLHRQRKAETRLAHQRVIQAPNGKQHEELCSLHWPQIHQIRWDHWTRLRYRTCRIRADL